MAFKDVNKSGAFMWSVQWNFYVRRGYENLCFRTFDISHPPGRRKILNYFLARDRRLRIYFEIHLKMFQMEI